MLVIALAITAVVLILIVLVVALPLRVRLHLRSAPRLQYEIRAALLGGASPSFRIADSERRAKKPARQRKKKGPKKKSTRSRGGPKWVGGLPRLVVELMRKIHIRRLRADAEFGFDDPADTGAAFGLLAPFIYGVPRPPNVDMALRPAFDRGGFAGEIDAIVDVRPAALVPPVVRFAWRALRARRP